MKLGVTLSKALLSLLNSSAIQVDFIKIDGDHDLATVEHARTLRPVLLHDISNRFWLNYRDPFDADEMNRARALLECAQPPWFSTGIGASAEPQGHTTDYWRGAPASARQTREVCLENILRNGKRLKAWLDIPLLLENYNYHPTNAYEYVCEPETFTALIDALDCEVLLDLAHAQISAFNLDWGDPRAYLTALPLERVREIHINHPYNDDNRQMLDRHLPLQASDLDLLGWVMERTPHLQVITLESESPDESTLAQEIELLRGIVE